MASERKKHFRVADAILRERGPSGDLWSLEDIGEKVLLEAHLNSLWARGQVERDGSFIIGGQDAMLITRRTTTRRAFDRLKTIAQRLSIDRTSTRTGGLCVAQERGFLRVNWPNFLKFQTQDSRQSKNTSASPSPSPSPTPSPTPSPRETCPQDSPPAAVSEATPGLGWRLGELIEAEGLRAWRERPRIGRAIRDGLQAALALTSLNANGDLEAVARNLVASCQAKGDRHPARYLAHRPQELAPRLESLAAGPFWTDEAAAPTERPAPPEDIEAERGRVCAERARPTVTSEEMKAITEGLASSLGWSKRGEPIAGKDLSAERERQKAELLAADGNGT